MVIFANSISASSRARSNEQYLGASLLRWLAIRAALGEFTQRQIN
jgi:hypothetical protein